MNDSCQRLKNRLETLVSHLIDENFEDYVLFALKKISDRQMLFISFEEYVVHNDPILKMQDLISEELETVIYGSEDVMISGEELESVINWLLQRFFKKGELIC